MTRVPLLSLAFLRALRPRTIHTTGRALRNTVGAVPYLRQWRLKVDAGEMKLVTNTSAGKNDEYIPLDSPIDTCSLYYRTRPSAVESVIYNDTMCYVAHTSP
jgi:hypothetical protein